MKLVIGLGNPGEKYKNTRHNAGFLALDYILKDFPKSCSSKFDAEIHEASVENEKVFFIYPQTYMNESGSAVRQILDFYKLEPKDLIILHDEVDLPLGTLRLTESSGSAGHNGIKSLIERLGTQDFKRIRIGVETREDKSQIPTDVFVLSPFAENELEKIPWEDIKKLVWENL
jgi:peptidyl-tRNA hydrolase, PTH1 family